MEKIGFFEEWEIRECIKRIETLFDTGIFHRRNMGNPFVRSAFIETIVCLRDLLYKAERHATRVSFKDDVIETDKVKDVTDLVVYVRNAVCHINSDNHYVVPGRVRVTFNIVYGQGDIAVDGEILRCEYPDDVCFGIGKQRVYLRRHIARALREAKEQLIPLIGSSFGS